MKKKSSKISELGALLMDNNITAETIERNDDFIFELKKRANTISDYRNESYIRHLLSDVVDYLFCRTCRC